MDTTFLSTVLDYIQTFTIIGGGLLCLWGVISFGTALKVHNGPAQQQALWQIIGGALIIAAGVLFGSVISLA